MHSAPPVRISLAGEPGWRASIIVGCVAAAANFSAWLAAMLQQPAAVTAALALLFAAVAGVAAQRVLRRRGAGGVLGWDGSTWHWTHASASTQDSTSVPGDVRIMIDLGPWLLLRFAPTDAARHATWLPLSRRHAGAAWPHWRAALFARRTGTQVAVADPS